MLYNPKTTAPSLEGFITWLAQQPRDKQYEYNSCGECAIGQYMQSCGTTYLDWLSEDQGGRMDTLSDWNHRITYNFPRTMGAAFERALKMRTTP